MCVKPLIMSNDEGGEDRISSLADDLIHHILSFSDAKLAVQTSVLSKRWKLVWTTLPSLSFLRNTQISETVGNKQISETKFVNNFLSHRNHEYGILSLNICFTYPPHRSLVGKFISYAITRNVQYLSVDILGSHRDASLNLSIFSSTSLKKLTLRIFCFGLAELLGWDIPITGYTSYSGKLSEFDVWDLPALTTLQLTSWPWKTQKLPELYLICLPSLRTLSLDSFELPDTISLPGLTSLHLARCDLPLKVWDIPALLTLILDDVVFCNDENKFLHALVNLQNLTLIFRKKIIPDCCCIDIPNLVNLEINYCPPTIPSNHSGNIMVLSRKIRNFSSVGIFPITFTHSELENVNIKLWDLSTEYKTFASKRTYKYYRRFAYLFQGLGSARILTLDLETIKALSAVSSFLNRSPSPFCKLKYVKVPEGYKESSISAYLICYLLGRSPKATIVTTFPRGNFIPQRWPVCLSSQNLLPEKLWETPIAGAYNDRAISCSFRVRPEFCWV